MSKMVLLQYNQMCRSSGGQYTSLFDMIKKEELDYPVKPDSDKNGKAVITIFLSLLCRVAFKR